MEKMLKLGPKEMKGSFWCEGGKTKIVQILISYGDYAVKSIQFLYVEDGKVLRSNIHGDFSGLKFDMVTINYPGEYLTSVSGQYYQDQLATIAFGTNKRKYGPFGHALDDSFSQFEYNFTPKYSFGGFYGSVYNSRIYAIGVYIRPLMSLAEIETYIGADDD